MRNEEKGPGARAMIYEGLFERFQMEEIHPTQNLPGTPVGQISTQPGLNCSSESLFEVTNPGQGGHAPMPQADRDVMTKYSEIVLAVQTAVSRKLHPGSGADVSVTKFVTEGSGSVQPGSTTLRRDFRARMPKERDKIGELMKLSENYARFSSKTPGCFRLLGNGQSGPPEQPLHSNDYDFCNAFLPDGVDFWTRPVRDRLPEMERG